MSKEIKALVLESNDGEPVLVHFGPGSVIKPRVNPNTGKAYDNVTRISLGGGPEFSVKGNWADIARRAGYGDVVKAKHVPTKHHNDDAGDRKKHDAPNSPKDGSSAGKTPDDPSAAAATDAPIAPPGTL